MLNFIPKSAFGPPGLWDAVRMIPPSVWCFLIRHDTAGVDRIPSWPIITFDTCILVEMNNSYQNIRLQYMIPIYQHDQLEIKLSQHFHTGGHSNKIASHKFSYIFSWES